KDVGFYGILPNSFDEPGAVAVGSRSIRTALANLLKLAIDRPAVSEFKAFGGFPETEAGYRVVFGSRPSAQDLAPWRTAVGELSGLASEYGVQTYAGGVLRAVGSKSALLREFENAAGILFLVAHANGCRVILPSGQTIEITPEDIATLH